MAPPAVQSAADRQSTPSKAVCLAGAPGLAMIFHAVPFHRSTSVVSVVKVVPALSPTAVQVVADAQLIPHRLLTAAPFGLGLGTGDQRDPFHRSIRVAGGKPLLSFTLPAAKQLDAVV